jgi:hypothetical protein
MASTFKRIKQAGIGASRTQVGAYTVPAATTVVVIGASFANVASGAVAVTLEHFDGSAYTKIGPVGLSLSVGQAYAPDEIGKIVLAAGDSLHVTSDTASSVDAFLSIMEIS